MVPGIADVNTTSGTTKSRLFCASQRLRVSAEYPHRTFDSKFAGFLRPEHLHVRAGEHRSSTHDFRRSADDGYAHVVWVNWL